MTSKYILQMLVLTAFSLMLWFLYPVQAENEFNVIQADHSILDAINEGGLVLFFRHGRTETSIPDNYPVNYQDCTTQRPLSKAGIEELKVIAPEIAQLNHLQAGEIIVSPFCRARDTADLLFPDHPKSIDILQMYTAMLTEGEKAPIIERTRELLSKPVAKGENRVIFAHAPNLAEVMGYYPDDADLVIIRPLGDDFEYLATIAADDWDRLLSHSASGE
ncbi:histidine phosphatase family protein [Methylophaga lonarensis]|uniref:histidine phosphatase family protein n=1 Tax=Methylophaga lonarensis TaxID=999151 RepID=UPI003D2A8B3F